MPVVALEYIEVDDRGTAKVIGTRTKVMQIVVDLQTGMTPEQIHEQYPHLSMAQIHAALAYYYDHRDEVDALIDESRRFVEELRANEPNRSTRAELEARWRAKFGTEPPGAGSSPE